jgi:hypothetical protein
LGPFPDRIDIKSLPIGSAVSFSTLVAVEDTEVGSLSVSHQAQFLALIPLLGGWISNHNQCVSNTT